MAYMHEFITDTYAGTSSFWLGKVGYVDEGSVHFVFLVLQFHVGLDEGGQGIVHVLLGQLPGDQRDH